MRPTTRSFLSLGFALVGVFGVGFYAVAQQGGGSHYVPYQGRLELNDTPVTALDLPMRFTFETEAGAFLAELPLEVDVSSGAFSVDGTPLGSRQRIGSVPRSSVAELASHMVVTQAIDVAGNAYVGGSVIVDNDLNAGGNAIVTGTLDVQGPGYIDGQLEVGANPLRFSNAWSGSTYSHVNRAEISNDVSAYQKLMIVGNRSAGGERQVGIWDDLSVSSDLSVGGGDANVQGGLTVDGRINVGRTDYDVNVAGGQGWGSWRGWTTCNVGYYVCGLQQRVEGDQGGGDDTAVNDIQIRCCSLGS